MNKWYESKVIEGKKIGRTIGFPTINLENPDLLKGKKRGVYTVLVNIGNSIYHGMLYFGPKLVLNEKKDILEIYIIDFNKNIYGDAISFQLMGFIRKPENFSSLTSLELQLLNDCQKAREILK